MKTLRNRLFLLIGAMLLATVLALGLLPRGANESGTGLPVAVPLLLGGGGVAALWLRRRNASAVRDGGGRLRVIDRIRLQPGRELCLLEAEGRHLLVTAGEGGVRLLARLGEEPRTPDGEPGP